MGKSVVDDSDKEDEFGSCSLRRTLLRCFRDNTSGSGSEELFFLLHSPYQVYIDYIEVIY